MALPCVTAAGLNAVPSALLGKAAGTLNTMQQFGAVFGIAIVTAVFNSNGSLADPAAVTSGYRAALGVAAGFSVLGALAAVGIRRSTRNGSLEPQPQTGPRMDRARLDRDRMDRDRMDRDRMDLHSFPVPASAGVE